MFITLEGIEGAGKTTQIPHIVDFLTNCGHACLLTREPGGTPLGKRIRQLLLDPANGDMAPEAELFLYAADRAQHVSKHIAPALEAGKTVVCDRFYDATEAYQGFARGLNMDLVHTLRQVATWGLIPDMTILFDLPPEVGLKRAWARIDQNGRGTTDCRFENEAIAFHRKVRQGYLEIARREPERFVIVNAEKSEADVRGQIIAGLEKWLA